MPRNEDVMLVCDQLEKTIVKIGPNGDLVPKFNKTAYMREYMRKRRAGKK